MAAPTLQAVRPSADLLGIGARSVEVVPTCRRQGVEDRYRRTYLRRFQRAREPTTLSAFVPTDQAHPCMVDRWCIGMLERDAARSEWVAVMDGIRYLCAVGSD